MTKYFLTLSIVLMPLFIYAQQSPGVTQPNEIERKADEFIRNYQFHRAIALLEKHLKHTGDGNREGEIDTWKKLAECHLKLGNTFKAKKYYNHIIENDSNHLQALNQLGVIYMKESNHKNAQACYEQLIQLDSTNSYYYKNLAKIKSKQGLLSSAIQLYDSSLFYNPDDLESIISLAEIYIELMEHDDSFKKSFSEALELGFGIDSLNRQLLELSAENSYHQKEYQSTINSLQLIFEHYQDTTGWQANLLGMAQKQLKNWQQAEKWFLWIIQKEEDAELTHYYLGTVYDQQNKNEKAIKHFELAIEKGISDNIHNYYVSLGDAFEARGELSKTIKAYQSAYEHSDLNILLYKLARSCDEYYKDKSIAMRYYQRFVDNSKQNNQYTEYARYRIDKIKEYLHARNEL